MPPIENLKDNLIQLREQLLQYRTAACNLVHEQVMEITEPNVPRDIEIAVLPVRRKGLCTPTARKYILGCAHTRANDVFGQIADAVHATGIMGEEKLPSSIINPLAVHIYLLDVQKSGLEKRLALARRHHDLPALESIPQQLSDVHAQHREAITTLETFRKELINRINSSLENE